VATTYSKVQLSGAESTGGWKTITDTSALGQTLHTAHASALDEVWLWATNEGDATETLTLEWGSLDHPQITRIPPKEPPIQIVPGFIITDGDVLSVFVSTTNVVTVHGYVNRITST
jgi:hypothetical protein